ncbi:MAG: ribosome biogenesis GTPase Der [Alphaproteobacteria bacterium]|nr:ribosome biogenesis GTPase Der [Alphaproteobacteria bacterium]
MPYAIAIVGRPNVGKSTLFNRLTGRKQAIVDDQPGVTRDRREGKGRLAALEFTLIDTAGLEEAMTGSLEERMRRQTEKAITSADLTLMVFDAREGITPQDKFFANAIRKSGAAVLLVGNKCEGKAGQSGIAEAWPLGFGTPIPVSAAHGEGLGDLHDAMVEVATQQGRLSELTGEVDDDIDDEEFGPDDEGEDGEEVWFDKAAERPMRIAVIGRPNMGKSTLINRLLGEERLLTGPEAGITRDAIEVPLSINDRDLVLIDTAGMRRRARINEDLEKQMVDDALSAIRFAHVCILCIDAREPLNKQDLAIARLVTEEGRGLVIAANMWDDVTDKNEVREELRYRLDQSLGQVRGLPLMTLSGLRGSGDHKMMDAAFDIYKRWNIRLSTSRVNRWLETMLEAHPPPLVQGRRLRIRYATQIKTRPPTFALFVSRPADLPEHYLRYLASGLRQDFDMDGLPIRLLMRKGNNPYVNT